MFTQRPEHVYSSFIQYLETMQMSTNREMETETVLAPPI